MTDQPQDPEVREATDDLLTSIDDTRQDMTETVEAIGDRLDPNRIVQDAKETVRDATVGRVETMTQQFTDVAGDAGQTIQSTAGGVVDTIRRNPVPAAMAAIGIGWLMTHRSTGNGSGAVRTRRWDDLPGRSTTHDPRSGQWQRGDDWTRGDGGSMVDDAGRAAEQVVGRARTTGSDLFDTVQREPLAAGAVALAVGTAVGMVVPASRMEHDVLGPAGQRVLGSVESAATDRMQAMREEDGRTSPGSTTTVGGYESQV